MPVFSSRRTLRAATVRPHAFLLFGCLFLAVGGSSRAGAATRSVPSQYATIRAAVTASASGDTIRLADGTYSGASNRDIDFGGKNITITSQHGAAKTIIDCGGAASSDGSGNHRGFYIHRGETAAVISGLTVKNGYENDGSSLPDSGFGGGICVDGGRASLQDCVLTGNTASENGGGVYAANGGSVITLANCTLSANTADFGGGIYNENDGSAITVTNCALMGNMAAHDGGGIYNNSVGGQITLTGCLLTGNTALEYGGGLYNQNDGSVITLANCALSANTADFGGGVYNANIAGSDSGSGTILLAECVITGNMATGSGYGGGVYNGNVGTVTLTACTIATNKGRYGGGVCDVNSDSGTTTLLGCTLTGNTASQYGGGVYSIAHGQAMLMNCALTGNKATLSGGGFYAITYGAAALTNCTVTQNTASVSGGGVYSATYGSAALTNTILYGDTGGEVTNDSNSTSSITAAYCDVQGAYPGTSNLNTNPRFVSASAPYDLHLQSASACLGAGTATDAPVTTLEGSPRPAPPSAGAYELSPGHTQILWNNVSGEASLWTLSVDGAHLNHEYGPYTGWTAKAVSEGPDGTAYLLWTKTDSTAAVWNLAPDGSRVQHSFGPYPGWKAVSLSTSPSGVSHLLWDKSDGTMSLWTLDTTSGGFTQVSYGPYQGWTANAVADGTGVTDLLWNNVSGAAYGWRLNSSGLVNKSFGPYSGWGAASLSVGPDDEAHLLWDNTSGQIALWNVDFATGGFTQTAYGPFSGWTAKALATGTDNVTHMLWNRASDSQMSLWNVAGSGYTNREYGPYAGWTATALSAGP